MRRASTAVDSFLNFPPSTHCSSMLPSPSSSPPRPVLINCTNDAAADERNASQHPLLTPPPDRKRPPAPELWASGSRKRVKLGQKESAERSSGESDDEDVFVPVRRGCRASTVFGMRSAMMAGPSTLGRICRTCVSFETHLRC